MEKSVNAYEVELPIVDEEEVIDEMYQLADEYKVVVELITDRGPSGGNPEYRFSAANKSDLLKFLIALGYVIAELDMIA